MFGIGMPELILILVVALIFFGPKRLPDLARSLGKGMAEFRKASDEVRQGLIEATREDERKDAPAKGEPGDPDTPSPYPPEAYGAPPATGPEAGGAPVSEPADVASVESKEDPAEPKREPGKEARPGGA